ncbi:MAG: 50S ribosomal protein L22 [Oligoflexia bacterium]|nr:50S ribosomal protein L22 [Oligoflexia bacterium]
MTVMVKNNNVLVGARKVRLVCDLIRGKPVGEALKILRFSDKKSIAIVITKLMNSGIAIATESGKYDLDNLVVNTIKVDEGPTMKRIQARAQGRAYRIRFRTSKVSLALAEK